jgi:hypothetical protein
MGQHADQSCEAAGKADQQGDIGPCWIGRQDLHRYLPRQEHADGDRHANHGENRAADAQREGGDKTGMAQCRRSCTAINSIDDRSMRDSTPA